MALDYLELQKLYDRIVLGAKVAQYNSVYYLIKDPGPNERLQSEVIYSKKFNELEQLNFLTKEEVEDIIVNRGIWGEDKEKELGRLQKNKDILFKELPSLEFRSARKQEVLFLIEKIDKKIEKLGKIKNCLQTTTVEYLSNYERYKYYIYALTFVNEQRLWSSWEEFQLAPDHLISFLIQSAYLDPSLNEANIRQLARSEPWRSTWLIAQKAGHLFDKPLIHLTDLQRALSTWSIIYDNAMESMEAPSSDVMNNDSLFDQWLKNQNEKRKKDRESKVPVNGEGKEVGIMVDSIEDAKKVYNLNSTDSLNIIKSREKALTEKGKLIEGQLPDVKQDLQMRKNQLEKQHVLGKN